MKLCSNCFNDSELATFIMSNSDEIGFCEYCQKRDVELLHIDELCDFFVEYLEVFKPDEVGLPLLDLIKKDWNLFSDETDSKLILENILNVINIDLKSSEINVVYIDEIEECTSYWKHLKEDLKWSRRYLTDMNNIFELGWDGFFNKQIGIEREECFFRSRIHRNEDVEVYKTDSMGCPDKSYANAGRANPIGIPYLYLSKSIDTTFYETRATFLDEISVGKFQLKKEENCVLVDFTESVSAFLNMGNILEYTKSILLKKYISLDLSKPLRRYDSELEYIPTQFICEFIRYITNADGIIFDSSLHFGGKNIVLFNENKMECIEVEKYQISKIEIVGNKI